MHDRLSKILSAVILFVYVTSSTLELFHFHEHILVTNGSNSKCLLKSPSKSAQGEYPEGHESRKKESLASYEICKLGISSGILRSPSTRAQGKMWKEETFAFYNLCSLRISDWFHRNNESDTHEDQTAFEQFCQICNFAKYNVSYLNIDNPFIVEKVVYTLNDVNISTYHFSRIYFAPQRAPPFIEAELSSIS
jgi:hypothetical protein